MKWTCLLFLIMTMSLNAQLKIIQFNQLDSLQKEAKKPVLIFLYSDWCRYCTAMKQTTFKNQKLIQFLNDHYYVLFFNPDSKEDVVFNDVYYRWIPEGVETGFHQFTDVLKQQANGIVLPSIYFWFQNRFQLLNQGYIKPEELIVLLKL